MNIWDSLCELLRARKVSVEDVSNKVRCQACLCLLNCTCPLLECWRMSTAGCCSSNAMALSLVLRRAVMADTKQGGMELRVLHMAAWRTTWYGRWGYAFGRGGFGIAKGAWRRAAESVSRVPLDALLQDFEGLNPVLPSLVQRYQVRSPLSVLVTRAFVTGRPVLAEASCATVAQQWEEMGSQPVPVVAEQGAGSGGRRAGTLGELLQRMLTLLSRRDEAAALVGATGTDPPDPPPQPAGCAGAGAGSDSEGGSQGARLGLQLLAGLGYVAPGAPSACGTSRKASKGSSGKPRSRKRKLALCPAADGGPSCKRRCDDAELPQVWYIDYDSCDSSKHCMSIIATSIGSGSCLGCMNGLIIAAGLLTRSCNKARYCTSSAKSEHTVRCCPSGGAGGRAAQAQALRAPRARGALVEKALERGEGAHGAVAHRESSAGLLFA